MSAAAGSAPTASCASTSFKARATRGSYSWDVGSLNLKPGQELHYFIEAQDGNTVKGAQKGVSKTQVIKLYSAAEHRREVAPLCLLASVSGGGLSPQEQDGIGEVKRSDAFCECAPGFSPVRE